MSSRQNTLWENAQRYGVETLSDADLLTLAVNKGTVAAREKALTHIQTLLAERGGLTGVLRSDLGPLLQHRCDEGLALCLQAVVELTRRLTRPPEHIDQIRSAEDVAQLVGPDMRYLDHEEMRVLVLTVNNQVAANIRLYQGTVNSSVLRTAELFRNAITRNCPQIIFCHNHPSGDPTPSPEDLEITRQCVQAGKRLEIEVLDHLIIGNPRFVSLKERMGW